jgi:hypothetical protein
MATTLHIEHAITDLSTWLTAFGAFDEVRQQAGVRDVTLRQPDDDPHFIVVDLEFDTNEHAHAFLGFLETNIWSMPMNSPALAGSPEAKILETVEVGASR